MTSAKYYSNWIKEAGRGHLTILLSGGSFLVYLCSMLIWLQADTEYTFFGIGNGGGVFYLCAGLGLLIGFVEFLYLLQERKQEFYYSLPVKKSTVFWTRYVHGVVGGIFPMTVYMLICGMYQGSMDEDFLPYATAYTMRSIFFYGMVFLLFYHIAVLAVVVCGRTVSAVFTVGMILCCSHILIQNICLVFAKNLYQTFYRIPMLERAEKVLVPWRLGRELTGGAGVFEKEKVLAFVPDKRIILAGILWIAILFAVLVLVQRKRKTEAVGKYWVTVGCERIAEILLAVVTGLWTGALTLDIGGFGGKSLWMVVLVTMLVGGVSALLVHVLMGRCIFRRKGKIQNAKVWVLLEIMTVSLGIGGMTAIGPSFDAFMPEETDVEQVRLCVYGLNMDRDEYEKCMAGKDSYWIERQMEQFTFSEDGLSEGMRWLYQLREEYKNGQEIDLGSAQAKQQIYTAEEQEYTKVTVCFQMKNKTEKYRTYPVNKTAFEELADVFACEEYKAAAYPVWENEDIEENRFTWSDGVAKQIMKLSGEEKVAFAEIYRKDIDTLKMSDLQEAPPAGVIEIRSEQWGETRSVIVYPFFENTCAFLKEHGIETERNLFDYPIRSIQVLETHPVKRGSVGGTIMHFYKEPEEIAVWKDRLIPEIFDLQPLLYPMDDSMDVEAEVEEPESGAVVTVKCRSIKSKGEIDRCRVQQN